MRVPNHVKYLQPIVVARLPLRKDSDGTDEIDALIDFNAFYSAQRTAMERSIGEHDFTRLMLKFEGDEFAELLLQPVDRGYRERVIPPTSYTTPTRAPIAILKEAVSGETGVRYAIGGLYHYVLFCHETALKRWLAQGAGQIRFRAQRLKKPARSRRKQQWLISLGPADYRVTSSEATHASS